MARTTTGRKSAKIAAARTVKSHQSNAHSSEHPQSLDDSSRRIDAIRVKALCTALVKLTNHDMEERLAEANIKLNISAFLPLRMLRDGPSTIQELSKLILVAPATLIPVIDELEAKGLVTRAASKTDRRVKVLHMTPKGIALIEKVHLLGSNAKLMTCIKSMPPKETKILITLLENIVTNISGSTNISDRIAAHVNKQMACQMPIHKQSKHTKGTVQ